MKAHISAQNRRLKTSPTNKPVQKWVARLLVLAAIAASTTVYSDDTEVYLKKSTLPPNETRSNVLLILDNSGSMGEEIDTSAFDSSKTLAETGKANFNGGAGDADYVYLYARRDDWNGPNIPFVYVNKVHKDQLGCDLSAYLNGSKDWSGNGTYTTFMYGDPSTITAWDGVGNFQGMCSESDSNCSFVSGSTGPKVDCKAQRVYVKDWNDFPGDTSTTSLRVASAKYHNYLQKKYRFSVLQLVVKDLLDNILSGNGGTAEYNLNMAMMDFNTPTGSYYSYGSDGGKVFQPSFLATDSSKVAAAKQSVSAMQFNTFTPLSETLWEASQYLRGDKATYGQSGSKDAFVDGDTSKNYKTPIEYSCQASHIIILTDGEPSTDSSSNSDIGKRMGYNCSGNCLDDYAQWLRRDDGTGTYTGYTRGSGTTGRRDHIPTTTLKEQQTIQVHTIGFTHNSTLLENTAEDGVDTASGIYAYANDATKLQAELESIVNTANFESDTDVAPAVAVNAYSGLQNRDELYFALFQPQPSPRWIGNLKKYKLKDGVIVDANGSDAIDDTGTRKGFFKATAKSYWWNVRDLNYDGDTTNDPQTDGNNISIGGIATNLTTPTKRKMYTYTGSTLTGVNLTNESLDTSNAAIAKTPTLMGSSVTTDAYADEIITWARGGSTDAKPNYFFPDIIHNPPVVVTYKTNTTSSGCSSSAPCFTDVLYAATNMGTLHSINPDDSKGTENWSFIPKELLPNLTSYYEKKGGFTAKVYGLDGKMQVWRHDAGNDGNIVSSDGDFVYLYQPMRRGGTNLYAFDVTAIDTPKLLWEIVGTGLSSKSGDFKGLAQTWSSPQRAQINWCASGSCSDAKNTRDVLFFGGGYDPVHDDTASAMASSEGNAIYMVDAKTGALLWSAGSGNTYSFDDSKLTNSFAADVTVGDVDGDGYIDLLYAVDIQGNVWRFDFDNNKDLSISSSGVKGGMVAQLGGTGTTATSTGNDFRRFYNAPDVAFFSPRGKAPFLTVSIASGFRAHPRTTNISDDLFVFFDPNATTHPSSYGYGPGGKPIDITSLGVAGSATDYGWYMPLAVSGEKGLSSTITFGGSILLTTYIPEAGTTCEGTTGSGRFYMLNALTGDTTLPDENSADPTATLAFKPLDDPGVPPEPKLIFGSTQTCTLNCGESDQKTKKSTKITACIGTECLTTPIPFSANRTYWRQNQ